mmetsp:Transcript_16657/g.24182  ORF Transcript_16657/g.24182 Transcript_16657/m.24182 type:complete len:219 (-) Transcript_16657:914-1570(-)
MMNANIIIPSPQQSNALQDGANANAELQLPPPITLTDMQDLTIRKRQGKAYKRQLAAKRMKVEAVNYQDLDAADDYVIKTVILDTIPAVQNLLNLPQFNGIQQLQQQIQQMQNQMQLNHVQINNQIQQLQNNHAQLLVQVRNSTLLAVNIRASNTDVLLKLQNTHGAYPQQPLAYPSSKLDLRDNFTANQVLALLNFYEIIPEGNRKTQLAAHIGATI